DPEPEPDDATNPRTRLPRTNGRWEGEPGNGDWFSDHPEVLKVTKGKPIRYIDGRPDFSPWVVGEPLVFDASVLDGSSRDFRKIYARLAQRLGLKTKVAAERYLRENKLTPHHLDERTVLLVPSALNNNTPHVGSASDMRKSGSKGQRRK
ncbi:MAG: HNH endonuclease, partial [Kiloniellales bacterium]|nr:HNH endonuclease [Kiloniellales bacterium]